MNEELEGILENIELLQMKSQLKTAAYEGAVGYFISLYKQERENLERYSAMYVKLNKLRYSND